MWYWYPLLVLSAPYTLLLFPSGLPSRRWRPVLWLLTAALAMMTVSAALMPNIDWGKKHVHNPIGLPVHVKDIEKTPLFGVAGVLLIVCVVASVASLAVRFRRSHGIERAQLKWFFLGSTLLGVNVVGSMVSTSFNHSAVSSVLTPFALSAMPFACGLAVLRYRLYDIDRVVSRTVSYAIVTGAIVGLYVGAVALADGVLGFSSNVAVAASTLAAAAAFQPLRRRVQHAVDRRFDRAAYDARRVADAFSLRLRNAVDVDRVTGDLLSTVATAVAPANASVWLVTQ
jgi:hypothetical protein